MRNFLFITDNILLNIIDNPVCAGRSERVDKEEKKHVFLKKSRHYSMLFFTFILKADKIPANGFLKTCLVVELDSRRKKRPHIVEPCSLIVKTP